MATLNLFVDKARRQETNPFIRKAREQSAPKRPLFEESSLPVDPVEMLALLQNLSDDELAEMVRAQQELEARLAEFGPQTDDELHAWIKNELGINIPRVAVCETHDAPFDVLADIYFERVGAILIMANRGGAKTLIVAILHWLNSLFKPGCESCTFGATEAQSLRCYAYLKGWIYDDNGEKKTVVVSSLMRETKFRNGSQVFILAGTESAVNGPHPMKAHADEIELMDEGTFRESRNMTVSKILDDGRVVSAQDICTSTRKGPNGRMQKLIDEITDAIRYGFQPPRVLRQWCIKETAAQVKNCQVANPHLSESEKCQCHLVKKGEWDDKDDEGRPLPRLLRDVCDGDFFKSRGWQPFSDVIKQFMENDQETFEVQQLCLKPEMQFHYLPKFLTYQDRYSIRNYEPDPDLGPIYLSVDWGGTNPHAVNWYQYLKFDIDVPAFMQDDHSGAIQMTRIPAGSIVIFDEIYRAEIGNGRLGQLVKLKESGYRRKWGEKWIVKERFADPAGRAARLEWKDIGLKTSWHITREFEEHIKVINDCFDDDLIYVDADKCPMWVREAHEWRRNPNTGQQIDTFNHCFVAGTSISTGRGEIPIEDVIVGDRVMTRYGMKHVTASGVTGFREEFIRLCVDGIVITCTPDHLIYTRNTGWTRADHITPGTVVLGLSRKWNLVGSFSDSMSQENIFVPYLDQGNLLSGFTSIEKFGNSIMDLYQRVLMSITNSQKIKQQSMLTGLSFVNEESTEVIMHESAGKKVISGMPKSIESPLALAMQNESNDSNAIAEQISRGTTTVEYVVENVESVLLPLQPVYDLTIEDAHEFYAGYILSHNCMSDFRYAIANIVKMHKRRRSNTAELPLGTPYVRQTPGVTTIRKTAEGPIGFAGNTNDEFALWRQSLGQPLQRSEFF